MIITKNHIHVNPFNGKGPVEIAMEFYNACGRVVMIQNKPEETFGEPFNFKKIH